MKASNKTSNGKADSRFKHRKERAGRHQKRELQYRALMREHMGALV